MNIIRLIQRRPDTSALEGLVYAFTGRKGICKICNLRDDNMGIYRLRILVGILMNSS